MTVTRHCYAVTGHGFFIAFYSKTCKTVTARSEYKSTDAATDIM